MTAPVISTNCVNTRFKLSELMSDVPVLSATHDALCLESRRLDYYSFFFF